MAQDSPYSNAASRAHDDRQRAAGITYDRAQRIARAIGRFESPRLWALLIKARIARYYGRTEPIRAWGQLTASIVAGELSARGYRP